MLRNDTKYTVLIEDVQDRGLLDAPEQAIQAWNGTADAPAALSEPGAHLIGFGSQAQPMEAYQMASTESKQAPTIEVEIHDFDINIDYPDFDFRGQCVS